MTRTESASVERNSTRSWMMFVILMLCGMAVGFSQLKVTPVMSDLAADLGVALTDAAWLMSIFTFAGILLSVPGAKYIGKFGPKKMLLFMLAMLVAGNLLGAVATNFALMFVSRLIEGIAAVFILPVGIELINRWFSGPAVGTATGIFMTATPVATFLMTSSALVIAGALGGIKALWWILAAYAAACFVLALLFVEVVPRAPLAAEGGAVPASASVAEEVRGAASSALLLLCAAMFFLTFMLYSLITCYPQLFVYYGLDAETSNLLTSLNGLVGIPMSVIAGIIIGKTGKPHAVALVGAVGAFFTCVTLPYLGEATYAVNVIASAVFPGGIVMAPMFVLAPLLVRKAELAPMGTSLMNTFFYLGQFVSTPVTTALSENNTNWNTPSIVLSAACVAFFALVFLSKSRLDAEGLKSPEAQEA